MSNPFYTIGHSTRSIDDFLALLGEADVRLVADVRTVPRSRANPQYNGDVVGASLAAHGLGYEHLAALGGLRGHSRSVGAQVNAFWENDSFHNYADYAMSPAFRDGLAHLRALGHRRRCAIMCAESLWWRCHRRIIADYLILAGETVLHIMGPGHIDEAKLTVAARPGPEGTLTYPAGP
jgi:uncharacterized protein (DUF488 family)